MIEIIVGIVGFIFLALVSYWTDKAKKQERKRDYYDG